MEPVVIFIFVCGLIGLAYSMGHDAGRGSGIEAFRSTFEDAVDTAVNSKTIEIEREYEERLEKEKIRLRKDFVSFHDIK